MPVLVIWGKYWCGREDSNFHGCYPTATSTLRVYQFRHDRTANDLVIGSLDQAIPLLKQKMPHSGGDAASASLASQRMRRKPCQNQHDHHISQLSGVVEKHSVYDPAGKEIECTRHRKAVPIQAAHHPLMRRDATGKSMAQSHHEGPKRKNRQQVDRAERADDTEIRYGKGAQRRQSHRQNPDIPDDLVYPVPPTAIDHHRPQSHGQHRSKGMNLDMGGRVKQRGKGHWLSPGWCETLPHLDKAPPDVP